MDKIIGMAKKAMGKKSEGGASSSAGGANKDDYGDKGR